ncbi:MAG: NADP-dependent isocitrate dehydrogenase [Magnetococcus sp. YQC-5]
MSQNNQTSQPDIIYTIVDEAPELASGSFLPIIRSFTRPAGITVGTKDISLAGRIIAAFPEQLSDAQRQPDDLAELGELVKTPEANVIKLPNISASVPQLNEAIQELQAQGYAIPNYPENPQNDVERDIKARFDKIKGSAVNPVLREGNSDRRAPFSVKGYAMKNPHKMGDWSPDSKTHVATMSSGDFFSNEKSHTVTEATAGVARIEFIAASGAVQTLKEKVLLTVGDVIDGTFMSASALRAFIVEQIEDTKRQGILFSLHMKATMMKVSDPMIFGQVVTVFFQEVFDKYASVFKEIGASPNNGLGDVLTKIAKLAKAQRPSATLNAIVG